ncbi:MAG: BREX-1 system adenine-specific DNA-methyltransferase PglX [Solirubrobacteraceae bacterium]|nr:BREX-1 system adenine-specific DNA-methyltransferase PglX [Solirubrobacteraceae bacterium]
MSPIPRPPSLDVPESEKRGYSEADVHAKLFEPDMLALGFPPRTNTQAEGEYFLEQGRLAVRRLRSGVDRATRGHYDGLYLVGNSPVVLCELKRFDALDRPADVERAERQLVGYALSEDFTEPPPFLVLYCGRADRTRWLRLRRMVDGAVLERADYEPLAEPWTWRQILRAQARGTFAEEVVAPERLLQILLQHLDRIEDDVRPQVSQVVQLVKGSAPPPGVVLSPFGEWLVGHREALRRMRQLYQRKVAEIGRAQDGPVIDEIATQAALNYLNKVFFLNLCEDRNLPGFYRIMREFLPDTRATTTPTTAAVFLTLLRRKIRDSAGDWSADEERAYRELRAELSPQIGAHVIGQNNWWELVRVAFDLAEERFPLVYRHDAFDDLRPSKETLAELVYDLSTKRFSALTNRHVGDIYQGLLSSRRRGIEGRGARRRQQSRLGAFYTPDADVRYMVGKLALDRDSRVLDPCMGSGHFLEGLYDHLLALHRAAGVGEADAYRQIVGEQLWGADIDTFATSLSAIRLFLLDEHGTKVAPSLFVHDMLLHTPERPGAELFSPEVLESEGRERATAERAVAEEVDPDVDRLASIDEREFDAIVGNPPYGARKPDYKRPVYARLYGRRERDLRAGSIATGDEDSYAMFFASGIERLREGGRMCLITNDSFRSLTTHAALRRHILDRCRVVEILLTDTKHFEGVSFAFAGMAITTLEKCSDERARRDNVMRLVDYVRDPADFANPPPDRVSELRQEEYEALPETPFFVGVPRDVLAAAQRSGRVGDVARGRVGLQTGHDNAFLAGIERPAPGLERVVSRSELASSVGEGERQAGIAPHLPHWVPFAKGEGFGEYWREPGVAIDWSQASVAELERRAALPAGTARKTYFRNRDHYFRPGLTYSVVSSGRISVRLMPEGCVWSDKGSAIFAEDEAVSERFLLGYLNSALATYFLKRIVNTTATAHAGYIEKLPFRAPAGELATRVERHVDAIIDLLRADPAVDIAGEREAIDDALFELFEIGEPSRALVRDFYETVGRA